MLDRLTRIRRLDLWLPLAAFIGYAAFFAFHVGAYAGGSDSSGYLNNARLLGEGRIIAPMRLLPGLAPDSLPSYTYVPLGFIPNPDHVTMTPTYPMGLPLLLLAAARLVGWAAAPSLVMGIHTLLGLWLVYRLGREVGLERGWAWLGVLLLAVSPLYVSMSLQMMSDVPALAWVTAAVLCALRSERRPWLALAAGLALAIAVLLRPTDLLAIVPVGLALGFSLRRWLLLVVGGLPGAIFQALVNYTAYHEILTTGYGDVGGIMGPRYVTVTLLFYLTWLPMVLTPLVYLAAGLPFLVRRLRGLAVVLAAWILVFAVFYLFYRHTHDEWGYLRFLLPAFPPLIAATLLVGRALTARFNLAARPAWLAGAGLLILIHGLAWSRHYYASHVGSGEAVYPKTAAWVREHLPASAVIVATQVSGTIFYYTDLPIVRWEMFKPAEFRRLVAACQAAGRPVYAVMFPHEIGQLGAFKDYVPGSWTKVGAVRQVTMWRYDGPPAP